MIEEKFNYINFFNEIETALTLHSHDIDRKIYEAPNVHNKILRQMIIEKNKLNKLETKYNKIFGEKFHYYRYNHEVKIESKEVAIFYVKNDPEFIKINDEFNKQSLLVETIERWMKKATSISFDIKNVIQYLEFMNGK